MSAPAGLGINFAQDGTDLPTHVAQLTYLKSLGITKIRVNIPVYTTETDNPNFRDAQRLICANAKQMGFYVIWGYKAFPLNSGNFAAFKAAMRSSAAWMKANNIDEIVVGNEEDLNTGYSQAQLQTQLKDICQTIKVTDGFTGTVSTAITTNVYAAWAADVANWQSFMKLDLHIYGGLAAGLFDSYATTVVSTLGSNVYCGEYGVDGAEGHGRAAFSNDADWVRELVRRTKLFQDNGWGSYYYFAYALGSNDASDTNWSAYRIFAGGETPLIRALARKRPRIVST